nr:TPA_asm: hypothetical protein HUJ06_013563 [Nelumbo nucifera]
MCSFFFPIYSNNYVFEIPELVDADIRHAKYGWLLMPRGRNSIFFFNPSTRTTINLPDIDYACEILGVSFSAPPTCSDCVVLAQFDCSPKSVSIYVCRRGESDWTNYRIENKNKVKFVASNSNPVFHEGRFYCLGKDGRVGAFDPSLGENGWTVLPKVIGH